MTDKINLHVTQMTALINAARDADMQDEKDGLRAVMAARKTGLPPGVKAVPVSILLALKGALDAWVAKISDKKWQNAWVGAYLKDYRRSVIEETGKEPDAQTMAVQRAAREGDVEAYATYARITAVQIAGLSA